MTMENQPSISRRGLLKWAGAGSIALAAAGALSACSPAQSELASTQGDTGAETDSALQERYADLPVEESRAYAVIVGGGAGGRSAIFVTLGTGIGGGVIVDGRLLTGAHSVGGELGHIEISAPDKAPCACGKRGCVEQYASANGIVRVTKKRLAESAEPSCLRAMEHFACKDVFDAARSGDALAAREVDEMTDTLGVALASIASTTDPEMFLIGGGVARAGDVLFDPLVVHFKTYAFKSCRETPIVPAILGNDAGIYGSVRLIVGE